MLTFTVTKVQIIIFIYMNIVESRVISQYMYVIHINILIEQSRKYDSIIDSSMYPSTLRIVKATWSNLFFFRVSDALKSQL